MDQLVQLNPAIRSRRHTRPLRRLLRSWRVVGSVLIGHRFLPGRIYLEGVSTLAA
jgi:hypothetical protein